MKFKIRTKLIIAFLAIILPFIAIGGAIALYNVNTIRKASLKAEAISEEMHTVLSLQLAIDKSLMPGNDYIITGDKKYIDDFNDASRDVEDLIKKVEGILVRLKGMETPEVKEETEILKSVRTSWQNIKEDSQRIFEIRNPLGNKEAARLMEEMDYKLAYPLIKLLDKHREIDRKEYAEAVEELQGVWRMAWKIMIGGEVILIIFGVFLALFYSRLFTRPIQAIHTRADAITKGEFKARLDIKTGDELEQLANAMNGMAEQLESLYSSLEQKVEERTRELRESNERFDLAVKGTNDGIWDWDIGTNTNYFSPRFLELLDYGPGELSYELATFEFLLHPEDRAWVFDRVRQHLEDKVPYNVEYRLHTKNGEYRWFLARGEAIRDQSGKPFRMAGSITDITERRQSEEKIKEQLDYLERFQKVALRRECRIKELTTEIEKLKAEIEELKKRNI